MAQAWCILQMSGPRTLSVVRSLRSAGFEIWLPMGMTRRKRPRSNKYRDEPEALLKALAFAPYEDAPRLSAIAQSIEHDHPPFSLLMHRDVYGKVADADLEPLREYETQRAGEWTAFVELEERMRLERIRKRKGRKRGKGRANAARCYVLGQTVRVEVSAFQGLTAKIVDSRRNGDLVIVFDGLPLPLTVEACDVKPVHVSNA